MYATKIQYDNGITETLTDTEPGLAPPKTGRRDFMPKQALCASHGWYTVVSVERLLASE